jgi:hypothetical protein
MGHFRSAMAGQSTIEKRVHPKKKLRGVPHVCTFENFKTALLGDIKQWSSRHHRYRHRYRRRHRRSGSIIEKTLNTVSQDEQEMNSMLRKGALPFVRSFVVYLVS